MVKNILLVIFSLLISVVLAEFFLWVTGTGYYSLEDRVLFYSAPSFVMDSGGVVKYAPDSRIRNVTVYGDYIDFDNFHETNNFGYIDSVDYAADSDTGKDVAFIGDSFTAGSGGSFSWVSELRGMISSSNISLYNLGVGGTGFYHFYQRMLDIETIVELEEVNIMVITNDFFRPDWYPLIKDGEGRFCRKRLSQEKCQRIAKPVFYIVEMDEDKNSLLQRASSIYEQKRKGKSGEVKLYQKLGLYNLFCDFYSLYNHRDTLKKTCPHLRVYKIRKYLKNRMYEDSMTQLKIMLKKFPDVHFRLFHIPEKGEVRAGEYAINIQSDIKQAGLEYIPLLHQCSWDTSMFHKHDAHPNDKGYKNLSECMTQYLY